MPTYKISGTMTVTCWTEVEADSEAEAMRLAANRSVADIHIDGSYPKDECWHMDTDGMPQDLHIDRD